MRGTTTYAIVQDVPATWTAYLEGVKRLGDPAPEGLLVHAAGPTEEGFRVIDVWESRAAWKRFRDNRLPGALEGSARAQPVHTTRALVVEHLLLAERATETRTVHPAPSPIGRKT
ncbi:MAG: hypothetical protein H0W14_08765 [Actinobacteria bacterium]|nr:hypothetical protein [Actinomycetota bacterium]